MALKIHKPLHVIPLGGREDIIHASKVLEGPSRKLGMDYHPQAK